MAVPVMLSVVSPPTWIYVKIEAWNTAIITPATVIIVRSIPTAFPQTPPPAVPEEQFCIDIRDNIDTGRIRQDYYIGGRLKYDGRRQTNPHANVYLRHGWKGSEARQYKKHCAKK
jgi:hypothetical protein